MPMVNINFQVRMDNFQEPTREYIQERIDRLEKLLTKYESFMIKIDPVSNTKSRYTTYKVEITVKMPSAYIKVEANGTNINNTVDKLVEPLSKKLSRYHDQEERWSKHKEWKMQQVLNAESIDTTLPGNVITDFEPNIRRKFYDDDKPLHPAEAVEKMELLGNNCFLFKNIENNRYGMIYKLSDGKYTLVQPET